MFKDRRALIEEGHANRLDEIYSAFNVAVQPTASALRIAKDAAQAVFDEKTALFKAEYEEAVSEAKAAHEAAVEEATEAFMIATDTNNRQRFEALKKLDADSKANSYSIRCGFIASICIFVGFALGGVTNAILVAIVGN